MLKILGKDKNSNIILDLEVFDLNGSLSSESSDGTLDKTICKELNAINRTDIERKQQEQQRIFQHSPVSKPFRYADMLGLTFINQETSKTVYSDTSFKTKTDNAEITPLGDSASTLSF